MAIFNRFSKMSGPFAALSKQMEQQRQQENEEMVDPKYRCRHCEKVFDQGAYCPDCLTESLVPVQTEAPSDGGE